MGYIDLAPVAGIPAADKVKLTPRKKGGTTISIPKGIADLIGLTPNGKMKVQIDMDAATRKLRFFADRAGPFTFKMRRGGHGFVMIGAGALPHLRETLAVEHQRDNLMIEVILPQEWQRPKPALTQEQIQASNQPEGAAWRNGGRNKTA